MLIIVVAKLIFFVQTHLDLLIPKPSTTEHQTPYTQWLHRKSTSSRLSSHVMDLVLLLATSRMIVTLLIVSLI